MKVGVPKEIKTHEYRVGLTPAAVREFTIRGHQVLVQTMAGAGMGAGDDSYRRAGARIVLDVESLFDQADLIIKVKEPQSSELALLRAHHILFTFLHLAPDPAQAVELCKAGCTAIAYETVRERDGSLPLLAPMSEVAGRLSITVAGNALMRSSRGRGLLLGGVPGVAPARVLVLGAGVAGTHAIQMALGAGAETTAIDQSLQRLRELNVQFAGRVRTLLSTRSAIEDELTQADVVVGSVLVPGASAPKLVTRAMLGTMKPNAVIIDIAIDQGGCFETSRPTTHANPTYETDGIIHYCVANMPGAVPLTSSHALNHATLPFGLALAERGLAALQDDPRLQAGLNVFGGHITHEQVANSLGMPYVPPLQALGRRVGTS